jgi:hypothetical protein
MARVVKADMKATTTAETTEQTCLGIVLSVPCQAKDLIKMRCSSSKASREYNHVIDQSRVRTVIVVAGWGSMIMSSPQLSGFA